MAKKKTKRGGHKKGHHRKKSGHKKAHHHKKKSGHRKAPRRHGKKKSGHKKKGHKKSHHKKKTHHHKKGARRKAPRRHGKKRNPPGGSPLTAAHYGAMAISQVKHKAAAEIKKVEKKARACAQKLDKLEDKIEELEKKKPRAAKKGKKKGSKRRARPGTKSKACKPFGGRKRKPVKCRTKPSDASLAGCGTAAERYGKTKRELCGPGTQRKPARALAEYRWHGTATGKKKKGGKKRNTGVHNADFWGA
jgi:hypothetical protein